MRPTSGFAAALVASVIGLSGVASAQQQPPARPDMLLREVVQGMPRGEGQEVRVFVATIQPGQATPFHTHRFPVTVYILEGAFTLEMEGRETVIARAGEAMVEPPNVRMTGYNRGSEPTRVVIFYVSDPGTPFLDPAH
ncbi:cupin domain-containing protein [Sabulicella rubraurantiaca]|uniref:cupin domain-containing protein n=1 Tax=Sabulicella rubraurantiaca TaxID=2811429 RepID=UPI001A96BB86|nr:cupin domain-containing protein [Sabulicella rubraurantiaca]